jgi:glycine hydroxymethyltransferase
VSAVLAAGTGTVFEQVVSASLDAELSVLDPEVAAGIDAELGRQRDEALAAAHPLYPGL